MSSRGPTPLLDLDTDTLAEVVGPPEYRVRQVRHWLYNQATAEIAEMTNLPRDLRSRLESHGVGSLETLERSVGEGGMTVKWLHASREAQIETVLMRYADRATVCVSSQAGCTQACSFCATGLAGFERQLTVGEIVEQVLVAKRYLRSLASEAGGAAAKGPNRVTNVVFMGMGEPLANYGPVVAAIGRLTSDCGISARSLTVSTIGIPDRIRTLARDAGQVTLAVSLHAADDELRNRLVPANRRWPIRDILDAVRDYRASGGRRVTIECTLIDGMNDGLDQAEALAHLVKPLRLHVNLIPMNRVDATELRPSSRATAHRFKSVLERRGVNATVRQSRGTDVDGGCGQLRKRAREELALSPGQAPSNATPKTSR